MNPPMRPRFIAELSGDHHRDLARCFDFIDTAARIGCDAVKFQLFKIDQLFAPEILAKSETHRRREEWELPLAFLPELARRGRDQGIQFSCAPFYLGAVAELEPHVDFYKIASYELLWGDLIRGCAATGKPLILSTGMATLPEIKHAVATACGAGCADVTLLHCISGYPTPPHECNLAAIDTLRTACGCPVGWSDHSVGPAVLYRAIHAWGEHRRAPPGPGGRGRRVRRRPLLAAGPDAERHRERQDRPGRRWQRRQGTGTERVARS
jgi:N-acetylneuraminate synthase